MVEDVLWIIFSALYVLFILAVACFLVKYHKIGNESARKLVHASVSLWVFVMVYGMNSLWARIAGPLAFIFINAFLWKRKGNAEHGGMNGLICFPFSLLLLSILYSAEVIKAGTAVSSMLVMGFGDSIAALVGMKYGKHKLFDKSAEGSSAMLIVSLLVLFLFSGKEWYMVIPVAVATAFAEAVSSKGWDNLTVPLITAVLLELL